MAPAVVELLGPHSVYWEPFCGSMAVLLKKSACRTEVVNDLHADLVNLARVVQSPTLGPKLYRALRRVLVSEALFRDSLLSVRTADAPANGRLDWERAFHYFISSWQGMNGVAGTADVNTCFARRFTSLGGDAGARWVGAVRSIPRWRKRIERVQILSCDGIEICEKVEDRDGVVVYADPPYLLKGAKYKHDFSGDDHARLAAALRRFKRTRVVLSYYDNPSLAGLYPGWDVRRVVATKGMVNSGKRDGGGRTDAPEVLLTNFTRAAAPSLFDRDAEADPMAGARS